jgi:alpha-galactosidase
MTLWSILAAPLLIGCDLTKLDRFTLAILTNDEVLEVDQDPMGKQGRRIRQKGDLEIWARPLVDKTWAVGLFNRGDKWAKMILRFEDIKLCGVQPVRDLWQRKDLGEFKNSFSTMVPIHGAAFVKVGHSI